MQAPFGLRLIFFCGSQEVYRDVCLNLNNSKIANLLIINIKILKRFEIEKLNVIKFSFPRNITQGDVLDRDMHGAQLAVLLSEMEF